MSSQVPYNNTARLSIKLNLKSRKTYKVRNTGCTQILIFIVQRSRISQSH